MDRRAQGSHDAIGDVGLDALKQNGSFQTRREADRFGKYPFIGGRLWIDLEP